MTLALKGKTVLVLGLGETGLSMAKWLAGRGAAVRVADSRANPPGHLELAGVPGVTLHLGGFPQEAFDAVDLVTISPGLAPNAVEFQAPLSAARERGIELMGDIELFARALPQPRPRIVAITGTNGKTTVTSLTGAMCRQAGLDCEVAGNISPAVLDAFARREAIGRLPDCWVLELSSFQLEVTSSLGADCATMLNLTEDHLDRHGSMREYAAAKARIFMGGGAQILNRDDPQSLAMALPNRPVVTFGLDAPRREEDYGVVSRGGEPWLAAGGRELLPVSAMKIAGLHNAANALAALALCRALGLAFEPLIEALRQFRGLAHRVEWIDRVKDVAYYDDSKGTNVGSTVAALRGLGGAGGRIVLIAGGEGKGQDFRPLSEPLRQHASALILIGRDAELIAQAVSGSGVPCLRATDMDDAVRTAARVAKAGDSVLLSPACASFDMFRNYAHRGEVFRNAVKELNDVRER